MSQKPERSETWDDIAGWFFIAVAAVIASGLLIAFWQT